MRIRLISSDVRALDHAVRSILATAKSAGATAVAIPLPTLNDTLRNGDVVSSESKRLIEVVSPTESVLAVFNKMTLPSAVVFSITA